MHKNEGENDWMDENPGFYDGSKNFSIFVIFPGVDRYILLSYIYIYEWNIKWGHVGKINLPLPGEPA